jgi:NADPH:quinone reductase-like Zn-dependent oxidoreductase
MKAVAYQQSLPTDHPDALQDITLEAPVANGRDLLVEVRAVSVNSVNSVDTKVRKGVASPAGEWKVLGWDAAGVVAAVGPEVTGFKPGDRASGHQVAADHLVPGDLPDQRGQDRVVGPGPEAPTGRELSSQEFLADRSRLPGVFCFGRVVRVSHPAGLEVQRSLEWRLYGNIVRPQLAERRRSSSASLK